MSVPTNTRNLSLITENSSTDSQRKFLTHRMDLNGNIASNMTKIDDWAGAINEKIVDLEKSKTSTVLNAIFVNTGYYEAVSSDIDEYRFNMVITVRFDKNIDGTTSVNINNLGVKSFMRYDEDGSLVNFSPNELKKERDYQFRYDGTSFVWQNNDISNMDIDGGYF